MSQTAKVSLFKSQKFRNSLANTTIYIILTIMSLIWLFPVVWLVANAFRGEDPGVVPYLFPKDWSFEPFRILFTDRFIESGQIKYLTWFFNTFIVALFTMIISTVVVLLTSYAFSRLRFKGRKTLMKMLMILGMFPGFMAMIAVYFILKGIGLLPQTTEGVPVSNYLIALILVYSGGAAMGYFVSKGYFDTISKSIDEAAMIDGASRAQIFWHITLPLSKPIVIYTALTSFMGPWGDYIFVATITKGEQSAWSIARGLYEMLNGVGMIGQYFTAFCAGAVLISIPIVALFIFMQKYYVSGITGGSVKG